MKYIGYVREKKSNFIKSYIASFPALNLYVNWSGYFSLIKEVKDQLHDIVQELKKTNVIKQETRLEITFNNDKQCFSVRTYPTSELDKIRRELCRFPARKLDIQI